jgi:hypothetical protein
MYNVSAEGTFEKREIKKNRDPYFQQKQSNYTTL